MKLAVLGAGSFGTAVAHVASQNGHRVVLYCRDEEQAAAINELRCNPRRFADVRLGELVEASSVLEVAVQGADMIVHAIPCQHTAAFVAAHVGLFPPGVPYVSTCKGIDTASHGLMSDTIERAMGGRATGTAGARAEIPLAFLSGPSFARDMVDGHPIGVVVASHDKWCAEAVQAALTSAVFRVYTSSDVVGVELGGALKNPLAIGAGIAKGLGYGQSTIAAMITRGCKELECLALALGGRSETVYGLSGFGDLMLTCTSSLSRNNRFGQHLATGMGTADALQEIGEVVEGFATSAEVIRLAKAHHVHMPLFSGIHKILCDELSPKEALQKLMASPAAEERFVG